MFKAMVNKYIKYLPLTCALILIYIIIVAYAVYNDERGETKNEDS